MVILRPHQRAREDRLDHLMLGDLTSSLFLDYRRSLKVTFSLKSSPACPYLESLLGKFVCVLLDCFYRGLGNQTASHGEWD